MTNLSQPPPSPTTHSKTALVLAGGGITGAVYEIGALRAINDMLVNHTVNDFDIYVGTSAGALVAAMLVNGLPPEEMMQAIDDSHPEVRGIQASDIFQSNFSEALRRLPRLPRTFLRSCRSVLAHFDEITLADILWEFADLLPSGFYSGAALERYIAEVLSRADCEDQFSAIHRELYIVATELDTGERAVFSRHSEPAVSISRAVTASSAVPVLYKPVKIHGREYIDGGIRGNASVDLAIEAGAELVVILNPLAPLNAPAIYGQGHHLSEGGLRTILRQSVRVLMHAGLRYHVKSLRRKYPHVDIILIEPQPDDQKMFGYELMDYASRLRVINHGFESVTVGLCERFEHYQAVLARHGIDISPRLVQEELEEIRSSGYDSAVLHRVLARNLAPRRARPAGPRSIRSTLDRLESSLDRLSHTLEQAA